MFLDPTLGVPMVGSLAAILTKESEFAHLPTRLTTGLSQLCQPAGSNQQRTTVRLRAGLPVHPRCGCLILLVRLHPNSTGDSTNLFALSPRSCCPGKEPR